MNCSLGLKIVENDTVGGLLVGVQDTVDLLNVPFWVVNNNPSSIIGGPEILIAENGEYCGEANYINGCNNVTCIRTDFSNPNEIEYCSVAFDYRVTPKFSTTTILPDNPFRFSEVVVEYVNEDGFSFRSVLRPQSDESQFEILEISDFEDNENGEKTRQLKVRFNCVLYGENDLSMNFENAEVVMAVAYPE